MQIQNTWINYLLNKTNINLSYIDPGICGDPVSLLEGHGAVHVVEWILVVLSDSHGPEHHRHSIVL